MRCLARVSCIATAMTLVLVSCSGGGPNAVRPTGTDSSAPGVGVPGTGVPSVDPTASGGAQPSNGGTSSSGPGGSTPSETTGSGGGNNSGGTTPYRGEVGVTKDNITLGFIFPKSGPYQALATNFEPAIRAGMSEINDAGGINGRKLVPMFGDDGYNNASLALSSVTAMKTKVFGLTTITFNAFAAVHQFTADNNIPYLYYNADREAGQKMRNGFPVTTFLNTQAEMLPRFMISKFQADRKKVGIIYQDTPDLKPSIADFKAKAKEAGIDVVISQQISETPSTCVNEVTKVQGAGAQVVWLAVGPVPVVCILRDADSVGYRPTWTGTSNAWTANVVNTASGCKTNGIIAMGSSHPIDSPGGQRYKKAMAKYFPNDPDAGDDDLAFIAYSTVRTWAEGLRRASSQLTRNSFIAGMETFRAWNGGFFAPATFGSGDRIGSRSVLTIQVRNCRWVEIDSTWRSRF